MEDPLKQFYGKALLSVGEVAIILGVSDKTVYKMIHKGQIPGYKKIGTLHRINTKIFLTKFGLI